MKKEILINATSSEIRVGITEDRRLAELFLELPDRDRHVGSIYLGRVEKVIQGMNAAFVDIGLEQHAFLHFSDAGNAGEDFSDLLTDDDDDAVETDGDSTTSSKKSSRSGSSKGRSGRGKGSSKKVSSKKSSSKKSEKASESDESDSAESSETSETDEKKSSGKSSSRRSSKSSKSSRSNKRGSSKKSDDEKASAVESSDSKESDAKDEGSETREPKEKSNRRSSSRRSGRGRGRGDSKEKNESEAKKGEEQNEKSAPEEKDSKDSNRGSEKKSSRGNSRRSGRRGSSKRRDGDTDGAEEKKQPREPEARRSGEKRENRNIRRDDDNRGNRILPEVKSEKPEVDGNRIAPEGDGKEGNRNEGSARSSRSRGRGRGRGGRNRGEGREGNAEGNPRNDENRSDRNRSDQEKGRQEKGKQEEKSGNQKSEEQKSGSSEEKSSKKASSRRKNSRRRGQSKKGVSTSEGNSDSRDSGGNTSENRSDGASEKPAVSKKSSRKSSSSTSKKSSSTEGEEKKASGKKSSSKKSSKKSSEKKSSSRKGSSKKGDSSSKGDPKPPAVMDAKLPTFQTRRHGEVTIALERGQEVLTQVTRESYASKGVKVSTKISLPGRFIVLMPLDPTIGISRKVLDVKERRRLRGIARKILPKGFGCIIRTVAQDKETTMLEEELRMLLERWSGIEEKLKDAKPPKHLYTEVSVANSVMRDLFTEDVAKVTIDNKALHEEIHEYVTWAAPQLANKIEYYGGREPIFQKFGLEKDLDRMMATKVWLNNGGYIIIEQTEAMMVIDVNSGRYAKEKEQELNALRINLESAREIARQIRLRDIGGLLVVDFIDLYEEKNRKKVYDEIKKEMARDRAKSVVLPMTQFGIVQMTRQRVRQQLVQTMSEQCPTCNGKGIVPSKGTVLRRIERWLAAFRADTKEFRLTLNANPNLVEFLTEGDSMSRLTKLMLKYFVRVKVIPDESLTMDEFRFTSNRRGLDITDRYIEKS